MDTKPAAAPPVVRRTAVAPRPAAVSAAPASLPQAPQDPDGDAPGGPSDEGAPSQPEVQGGPMSAYAKPLQDLVEKVTKHGQKLLPFLHNPDVAQAHQRIVDASTLLQSAIAGLAATPFDPKAKAARAGLYPGAVVKLTARAVGHYAGLFNSSSRFTVISLHDTRLLAEAPGSVGKIFFSMKEVEIAQDVDEDTAQA